MKAACKPTLSVNYCMLILPRVGVLLYMAGKVDWLSNTASMCDLLIAEPVLFLSNVLGDWGLI